MAAAVTPDAVRAAALEIMARRWVWGVSDCSAAACDVFARLHGVDPLAPLRGRYRTAAEARAAQGPDWAVVCRGLAARAGLVEGAEVPGALGLIRHAEGLALAVCIRPGLWAAKTLGGVAEVQAEAECCWSV